MTEDLGYDLGLKGKVAIVTGGAGILGREFSRGLLRSGARVAVVDVKNAEEAAEELRTELGAEVIGCPCDITVPDQVLATVAAVRDEFGDIDILHNNAATKTGDLAGFFAPFEEYTLESWREVMAVNVDGMFLMAQAVGRTMIERGQGGVIVNTGSIYGLVASDHRIYEGSFYLGRQISNPVVYSVSKAAVVGLTRQLAAYWAPHQIRVNCLVPGGVSSGQNNEFSDRYSARVPLGRMAEREDLVGALLYLASPRSGYVTGQCLVVDGGLTAW